MSQTKAQLVGGVGISTVGDLSVYGGVNVTGVVTASSFVGNLIGTASTATASGTAYELTGTPNITVGFITATGASISGNVSIGGTLTYEDVTNVDSVGLITARSGVNVTGGSVVVGSAVTLSSGGINVAGVVTATSFVGNGSGLTGAGSTVADDTTTNATFYPIITQTTSGTITASKVSTSKLSFNPSTGTLTSTQVNDSGGNVRALTNNAKGTSYILTIGDVGELINITSGGVTVPSGVFSAGDNITIYNNSASAQTITQGSSVTLRLVGTTSTGNRTLDQRGLATVLCVASNEFVISGGGLS